MQTYYFQDHKEKEVVTGILIELGENPRRNNTKKIFPSAPPHNTDDKFSHSTAQASFEFTLIPQGRLRPPTAVSRKQEFIFFSMSLTDSDITEGILNIKYYLRDIHSNSAFNAAHAKPVIIFNVEDQDEKTIQKDYNEVCQTLDSPVTIPILLVDPSGHRDEFSLDKALSIIYSIHEENVLIERINLKPKIAGLNELLTNTLTENQHAQLERKWQNLMDYYTQLQKSQDAHDKLLQPKLNAYETFFSSAQRCTSIQSLKLNIEELQGNNDFCQGRSKVYAIFHSRPSQSATLLNKLWNVSCKIETEQKAIAPLSSR